MGILSSDNDLSSSTPFGEPSHVINDPSIPKLSNQNKPSSSDQHQRDLSLPHVTFKLVSTQVIPSSLSKKDTTMIV